MRQAYVVCDKCFICKWYWRNNDEGCECVGDVRPCYKFLDSDQLTLEVKEEPKNV